MKVLLLKMSISLAVLGDIKKVADGFGRNYLIPQGLALPATAGSLKLAESISKKATYNVFFEQRTQGVADILAELLLDFSVKPAKPESFTAPSPANDC